ETATARGASPRAVRAEMVLPHARRHWRDGLDQAVYQSQRGACRSPRVVQRPLPGWDRKRLNFARIPAAGLKRPRTRLVFPRFFRLFSRPATIVAASLGPGHRKLLVRSRLGQMTT